MTRHHWPAGNDIPKHYTTVNHAAPSQPPHTALNWIGSMLAIAGTGLYSLAKQKAGNDAKKAKPA